MKLSVINNLKKQGAALTVVLALFSASAFAQTKTAGTYIYPAKGQSKAQQDRDEAACYQWAKNETGVDPLNPPKGNREHEKVHGGKKVAVNTAAGAAVGAGVGAIAGDAGKGAIIGGAAGATRGFLRKRKATKTAEATANANANNYEAEEMAKYRHAFAACMEGKGYSVK